MRPRGEHTVGAPPRASLCRLIEDWSIVSIAMVSTGLALPLEEGSVQRDATKVGGGLDRLEDEPHGDPVGRVAA